MLPDSQISLGESAVKQIRSLSEMSAENISGGKMRAPKGKQNKPCLFMQFIHPSGLLQFFLWQVEKNKVKNKLQLVAKKGGI